jgi:hypothetical protein
MITLEVTMSRIGKFYMSNEVVRDAEAHDFARLVFGLCVILRAEYLAAYDKFEYYAICSEFDEIEQHCVAPEYRAIIDTDLNRAYFERVE